MHTRRIYRFATAVFAVAGLCSLAAVTDVSAAQLDEAYAALRAWPGGDEGKAHTAVREHVDEATAVYKVRLDAERRLIAVLDAEGVSKPAKQFAAAQLYRVCDEDTVPDLERLLARGDTWDLAAAGLERIKHAKAGQTLIDAAERAKGERLIGIIDALGNRHDPVAVPVLRLKAEAGDAKTTEAALTALGKIPGAESMQALDWCRKNLTRKLRPAATLAYLQCGQTSLARGDTKTAIALFEGLLLDFEPAEIQAEGLRGLIKAKGESAVPTIIEALTGGIPELEAVAAAEAHTVPGRKATQAYIAAYPDLTPENQAVLLRAFGERRDEAALPTVLLAAQSRVPTVRVAALESLGRFNHPDAVQILLKASVTGPAEEQTLARESLRKIEHPELNDQLLVAAMSADNTVRAEAIKLLGARGAHEGVPVLLRIAERDVKTVRLEALKALGQVGAVTELTPMVGMMTREWTDEERAEIGQAIIAVARRAPAGKGRTDAAGRALTSGASDEDVRLSLVSILGAIADDSGLPALETVAKKPGGRVQRAALETLAGWPNAAPLDTLDRVARADKDAGLRTVALEGALRQLERDTALPDAQRVKYLNSLAAAAQTPEQKQRIAHALASMSHPDAQKLRQKLESGD